MPGPQLRGSNPFTGNHTTVRQKKSVCFSVHTLFFMSQYVVIVVPTK